MKPKLLVITSIRVGLNQKLTEFLNFYNNIVVFNRYVQMESNIKKTVTPNLTFFLLLDSKSGFRTSTESAK